MTTRRRLIVGAALVAGAVLLVVADALAGLKYPVALTLLGIGGAALLIAVAVAVPGTLLARPEGTRAGELGFGDDVQARVEGSAGDTMGASGDTTAPVPGSERGSGDA
jgi:hypothetical protein